MTAMTLIYAQWFPATVLLPDKSVIHRARVYATDEGLKVFTRKPEDGVTPQWQADIDFSQTSQPDMQIRNNGIDFETTEGLAVVTPTGGCKCGGMSRWIPAWATNTSPWPVAV
jgi:hypothetical protein